MKKLLISLAATALVTGAALPAAAQSWRDHDRSDRNEFVRPNPSRLSSSYVDSLEWKINNAAREGRISRGERRELMREFRSVQTIAGRVERGWASRGEIARLSRTVDHIESAIGVRYARGYGR